MFCIHAVPSLLVRTSKPIFALGKVMSYASPDGHINYLLHSELCVLPGWDLKKLARKETVAARANDGEIIHWCISHLST